MFKIVTFILIAGVTNGQINNPLSCNGVMINQVIEVAIPTDICLGFDLLSVDYAASIIFECEEGSVIYKNYTDTNCSGTPEFVQDFCEFVEDEEAGVYCESFCDLGGCPYIKDTQYNVTECGEEEYPSEYIEYSEFAWIEGYCYDLYYQRYSYSNNGTHALMNAYDNSDCSGDPVDVIIYGELGVSCNETTLIHRVLVNDTVNASAITEPFMSSTTEPIMISTTEMLLSTVDTFLSSIYDTVSMSTEERRQKPPKS